MNIPQQWSLISDPLNSSKSVFSPATPVQDLLAERTSSCAGNAARALAWLGLQSQQTPCLQGGTATASLTEVTLTLSLTC